MIEVTFRFIRDNNATYDHSSLCSSSLQLQGGGLSATVAPLLLSSYPGVSVPAWLQPWLHIILIPVCTPHHHAALPIPESHGRGLQDEHCAEIPNISIIANYMQSLRRLPTWKLCAHAASAFCPTLQCTSSGEFKLQMTLNEDHDGIIRTQRKNS